MSARRASGLPILALLLAGCGSLSAPPGDHFYRLEPPHPASVAPDADAPLVVVPPLSASGVHAERALVYVHPDDITLEQYNYHYWIESPRIMLQLALADHLRRQLGVRVVTDYVPDADHVVRGRIVRFERVADGADGRDAAAVAVHVDVVDHGRAAASWSRDYEHVAALEGDGMVDYVAATNTAVEAVLAQLTGDLRRAWSR